MYNVRLFGNEIILNPSVNLPCFMLSVICCDQINDYPECNITNKKMDHVDENYYYQSLFLLRENMGYNYYPNISFLNISFINFNSLTNEGWRTLILINTFSFGTILNNVLFLNSFLSHGFMKVVFLDLDQNNQDPIYKIGHITFLDTKIEKYNLFEIQEDQFLNSNGLFQFSSGIKFIILMDNFILQYINLKNSVTTEKYCFYFEDSGRFNQIEISRLFVDKVIGFGFINALFTFIQVKDFYFSQITLNGTPIFSLKNHSILHFQSGIITNLSNYFFINVNNRQSSFFSSFDSCQIVFNSTYHYSISDNFGLTINSQISYVNSSFDIIKLENAYNFMILQDSNCSFIGTSFSNLISYFQGQSFFKILSVIYLNFLNFEGVQFINITSSSCFIFQSINFIPISIVNFYDIEVQGTYGIFDKLATNIKSVFIVSLTSSIHTISIRKALIHDCETFSLIELQYYLILMNLVDVEFKKLKFSYASLMFIFVQEIFMNDHTNSIVTMENMTIIDSLWDSNVFFIASINRAFNLSFFDCYLQNIFAFKFIELQSSEKNLKIFLKNNTILRTNFTERNSKFFLIFTDQYSLDRINVENFNLYNFCGSFIYLSGKFNNIIFKNFNGYNIFNDNFYFFRFQQIFEPNEKLIQKSKILISGMFFRDFIISPFPSHGFFTINVPIDLEFANSTYEKIQTWTLFLFQANDQLINIKIFFVNIFQAQNYFILLFLNGKFIQIDLENIYIYQSYNFQLIDLRQIFKIILLKNIFISTIFYVEFYILIVSQQVSNSLDYKQMNIENFTVINLGFETKFYSPVSLFLIWQFDDLIMNNIKIFDISTITATLQGTAFIAEFENLKYVSLSGFIFIQTTSINLDQTLKFNIIENLNISGSHFEIPLTVRRFQAFYVLRCVKVNFENNWIIGMSTVEKPQFIQEETGVASFLVGSSYEKLNNDGFTLNFTSKPNKTKYIVFN